MTVREELDKIADANGGMVSPDKVVRYAQRNTKSALHHKFTWDDSEAAVAYRLHQARNIIRVHVTVINGDNTPVRAFVSLQQDRGETGYRRTVDVLANADLKSIMLEEAKAEMQIFASKYRTLSELAPVIRAIDRAVGSRPKKKPKQTRKPGGRRKAATAGA